MDSYMEIILAKGNDSNRIAMATRTTMGGNARMLGTSLAGRAKAFGRLNNVNVYAAFVTVAIKPAKCEDSGLYICTVGYYLHGKSYEVRDRKNTTVHSEWKNLPYFCHGCWCSSNNNNNNNSVNNNKLIPPNPLPHTHTHAHTHTHNLTQTHTHTHKQINTHTQPFTNKHTPTHTHNTSHKPTHK